MRIETVNAITKFQIVGAVINIVVVWFTLNLYVSLTEKTIIIACINIAYVLISKDIAVKYEQITCKRVDRFQ